jgi:predicted secreted protein
MKKLIPLFTFILVSMLMVTGCAIQTQVPPVTSTPEIPVVSPTAAADQNVVTLADSGKTITLKVGENFLLKLGNDYTWNINVSDESVISRVKNVMVILGAQGIYDALKPGTAVLSATGDPQCRQATPACAAPSIQFSVTVVVQ